MSPVTHGCQALLPMLRGTHGVVSLPRSCTLIILTEQFLLSLHWFKMKSFFVCLNLGLLCMGNEIRIGFMGFSGSHSPVVQVKRLGSALPIAIDKINENVSIFGNVNVSYEMVETACEPKKTLGALVEMVKEWNISVLIGPSCGNEKEVYSWTLGVTMEYPNTELR